MLPAKYPFFPKFLQPDCPQSLIKGRRKEGEAITGLLLLLASPKKEGEGYTAPTPNLFESQRGAHVTLHKGNKGTMLSILPPPRVPAEVAPFL